MIQDWHYKCLDSLWLLATSESPADPLIFACEAHEITKFQKAVDAMVRLGLILHSREEGVGGEIYDLYSLTRRGLAEAEHRNLSDKVREDHSAKAAAVEVEATRSQYADNPMWGLL